MFENYANMLIERIDTLLSLNSWIVCLLIEVVDHNEFYEPEVFKDLRLFPDPV